jgi:hypothetical protein
MFFRSQGCSLEKDLGEQIYLLQEVNPVWLHEHIKDFWRSLIPTYVGGSLES